MALEFQKVPVPVSQGLADGIDDRLLPVGKMLHARNVIWDKSGAISVRPAFSRCVMEGEADLANATPTLSAASRLFSNGVELCAVYNRYLYAWSDEANLWLNRGRVSPYCGEQRINWTDRISFPEADLYEDTYSDTGLIGYVAAGQSSFLSTSEYDRTRYVYAGIWDRDHQVIQERQLIAQGTSNEGADTKPHAVRAFGQTSALLISFLKNNGVQAAANIQIWGASKTDTQAGYALKQTLLDASHYGYNERTYDAIELDNGQYAVAWCRWTAGDIRVERFNGVHGSVIGANFAAPANYKYVRVSIAEQPIGDPTPCYCLLTVREHTATGDQILESWAIRYDNLAVMWGPTATDTATSPDYFDNIGVCPYSYHRMCCVWGKHEKLAVPIAHDGWCAKSAVYNTEALFLYAAAGTIYNCIPYGKPFTMPTEDAYEARLYCVITTHTKDDLSYVFEGRGCYELFPMGAEDPLEFYHCGTWDPGIANASTGNTETTLCIGSCNSMSYADVPSGQTRIADVVRTDTSKPAIDEALHRFGATTYTLDFHRQPRAEYVDRGVTAIGGGMVQLYDGARVDELGFVFPPIIAGVEDRAGFGGPPIQTLYYSAVWETYDHAGNWHRSSPTRQFTYSHGEESWVNVYTRSLPQTIRRGDTDQVFGASFFRADVSSVARMVNAPEVITRNQGYYNSGYLNGLFVDGTVTPRGRNLYTESGALESIPPMGAALVMVQNERVWLGGMVRRDFVQFSKRYTPGVATTPLVAPEFSEGFGMATPSGRAVTGLGKLDDKVIVLTNREVYAVTGHGPNDDGSGDDHSGLVLISTDAGCINPQSPVSYPGGVFFESSNGIWHLDRGMKVTRSGDAAEDVLADYPVIVDAVTWTDRNLVIWALQNTAGTDGTLLVYDYATRNWCDWVILNHTPVPVIPLALAVHDDELYVSDKGGHIYKSYYDATGTMKDDSANWIPMEIETAWIQAAGQSGWQRVKNVQVLLAEKGDHDLAVSVYHDFETTSPQTQTWTDTEITSFPKEGVREQVQMRIARQKTQAIKVRIATAVGTDGAALTAGPTIAGLMLEIGQKRGAAKMPAEQRK